MEYYAAIKNKILPFSAIWMDLEDIMPSGISQMGGEWCIISLICGIFGKYSTLVNITKKQTYRDERIITRKVKELWSCHIGKKRLLPHYMKLCV